jgi:hypothetical protein
MRIEDSLERRVKEFRNAEFGLRIEKEKTPKSEIDIMLHNKYNLTLGERAGTS